MATTEETVGVAVSDCLDFLFLSVCSTIFGRDIAAMIIWNLQSKL